MLNLYDDIYVFLTRRVSKTRVSFTNIYQNFNQHDISRSRPIWTLD